MRMQTSSAMQPSPVRPDAEARIHGSLSIGLQICRFLRRPGWIPWDGLAWSGHGSGGCAYLNRPLDVACSWKLDFIGCVIGCALSLDAWLDAHFH